MNFCKFLYKESFLGSSIWNTLINFLIFFSGIKNSTVKLPGNKFQQAESEEGNP